MNFVDNEDDFYWNWQFNHALFELIPKIAARFETKQDSIKKSLLYNLHTKPSASLFFSFEKQNVHYVNNLIISKI